jgi:hypothetical protein
VAGICEQEQFGNIKYKLVYNCTITGLPPVIKNAWKNVEYQGQSLQQNSPYQEYIYNSINTLGTSGPVSTEQDHLDASSSASTAVNRCIATALTNQPVGGKQLPPTSQEAMQSLGTEVGERDGLGT